MIYTSKRIFFKGVNIMNLLNYFNGTFITILGYELSFLEFLATIFGILNVYLLAKLKVSNYFWGILNVILTFFICYKVQMYSNMALQVYYLIIDIYGLWIWSKKYDNNDELKVSTNSTVYNLKTSVIFLLGFIVLGFLLKNIHNILPVLFKTAESSPFIDSFITTLSIVAMYFMAKKKIEHWYLWFLADLVSAVFFYSQGIKFLALEYLVFLFFAFLGYIEWKKELICQHDSKNLESKQKLKGA